MSTVRGHAGAKHDRAEQEARGHIRALGLGKIGRSAEHTESEVLAGQLRHVAHLVKVEGKDA